MPRILSGLTYDQYDAMDGVRVSSLLHMRRSPLHARYEILHPSENTPSTLLGTAVHCAVLEPERYRDEYVEAPECDKRTRDGKARWSEFEAAHAGAHTVLRREESERVAAITLSVRAHPMVGHLLESAPASMREASVQWDVDGLLCRGRIDIIAATRPETIVADLKTCRDARPEAFARAIHTYGYHVQAGGYLDAIQAVAPTRSRRLFAWIAVENEPPHGVAVYLASEGLLAQGREEFVRCAQRYRECRESGIWPGYPPHMTEIDLPKWAWRGDHERE